MYNYRLHTSFIALILGALAAAQHVSYSTPGSSYVENFNNNPGSGTYAQGTDVTGFYAVRQYNPGTGFGATPVSMSQYTGGSSTPGVYGMFDFFNGSFDQSFGTIAGNGGLSDTIKNLAFGLVIKNTTGVALDQFTLSYRGEQYRNSGASAHTIKFGYHKSLFPIGTVSQIAISDSLVTSVPQLNFTSPVFGGASSSLPGNLTANSVLISHTVTGISWQPNELLTLHWQDIFQLTSAGHGMAIDDVQFTAVPEPSSLLGLGILAYGSLRRKRRSPKCTAKG